MEEVTLNKALIESRLLHEQYQMTLAPWHQFVIWSYTLGSGTVNASLLGMMDAKSLEIWADRIATTYQDVSRTKKYELPKAFQKYKSFLEGKGTLTKERREEFLKMYTRNLQYIIEKAPPLTGEVIVHKASSPYPGLKVGDVPQKPFNSASYRIDMNYSAFLPPGGMCCMHRITLRKGAKVLILSPLLSAYPDEAEIILPFSVIFRVTFVSTMSVDFPKSDTTVTWKKVQESPYVMGPVFFYNYKNDCNTVKKDIQLYNSVLIQS